MRAATRSSPSSSHTRPHASRDLRARAQCSPHGPDGSAAPRTRARPCAARCAASGRATAIRLRGMRHEGTQPDSSFCRRRAAAVARAERDACRRRRRPTRTRSASLVAVDVELVARRRVEGAAAVRADLRTNPAVAQKCEGAPSRGTASEIEVKRPVPGSTEMEASGRVEQRRELRSPIALTLRRDRRELLADVLGRDHSSTPSSASSRRLTSTPVPP